GLGRSVSVGDLQLHQQGKVVAVDGVLVLPAEVATIPAVPEQALDDVLAGRDKVRDIVGLVTEVMVVARPARREDMVADPLAVERDRVDAERGRVDASASDLPLCFEGPLHEGRWVTEGRSLGR